MKKLVAICLSLMLAVSLAAVPAHAGGDKNHGDVGQGSVDQGDTGSDTGNASGDNAQGNQKG